MPNATATNGRAATTPAGSTPAVPTPAAPSDGSGSLVYILNGEVWLSAPDGSAARQLTSDGSAAAYHSPSQADDGSIFVLRGERTLVQLDRAGNQLRPPVTLATLENGADGLAVAPDGQHIAYVTTGYGTEVDPRFGNPVSTFLYGGTDVATPDGTSVAGAALGNMLYPNWLGSGELVLADGVSIYHAALGSEPSVWLARDEGCVIELDCPTDSPVQGNLSMPALSPDGTVLAYNSQPFFGDAGRVMAELTAPPPAPPADRCLITGHANFSDIGSLRADGGAFAFDDTSFDRETFETTVGEGVHVMDVNLGAPDCGVSSARLVVPGGSQPDWGPAAP